MSRRGPYSRLIYVSFLNSFNTSSGVKTEINAFVPVYNNNIIAVSMRYIKSVGGGVYRFFYLLDGVGGETC